MSDLFICQYWIPKLHDFPVAKFLLLYVFMPTDSLFLYYLVHLHYVYFYISVTDLFCKYAQLFASV